MTGPRAGLKPGYYLLNTDGGMAPNGRRRSSGDPLGHAAIGALLRTRRLVTVAQISKAIGPATHNVAEYRALIAGLELAREYGIQHVRVYMDSELVVDQVNGVSAVRRAHLGELHEVATRLMAHFKSRRVQLGASGDEHRGRQTREGCLPRPRLAIRARRRTERSAALGQHADASRYRPPLRSAPRDRASAQVRRREVGVRDEARLHDHARRDMIFAWIWICH